MSFAIWVVIAALTPVIVGRYDITGHALWMPCSLLALLLWLGLWIVGERTTEAREAVAAYSLAQSVGLTAPFLLLIVPLLGALILVVLARSRTRSRRSTSPPWCWACSWEPSPCSCWSSCTGVRSRRPPGRVARNGRLERLTDTERPVGPPLGFAGWQRPGVRVPFASRQTRDPRLPCPPAGGSTRGPNTGRRDRAEPLADRPGTGALSRR